MNLQHDIDISWSFTILFEINFSPIISIISLIIASFFEFLIEPIPNEYIIVILFIDKLIISGITLFFIISIIFESSWICENSKNSSSLIDIINILQVTIPSV